MSRRNLTTQLALPTLLVTILGVVSFALYVGHTARESTVEQLTMSAVTQIGEYRELRNYYSEKVVAKVHGKGIAAAANHDGVDATIPLPATLIHDLSNRFRGQSRPVRLSLYSRFPFPNRTDRELDDFARAALRHLKSTPDAVFSELSVIEGERFVRVAIADRMTSQACVDCHNTHPDSPRIGWVLGDVRGVLEVDLRAEEALAAVGVQQAKIFAFGGLLCLAIFVVVGFVVRQIRERLHGTVEVLKRVAEGDLEGAGLEAGLGSRFDSASIPIPIDGANTVDELDVMNWALRKAIANMRDTFESLHQSRALIDQAPVSLLYCDSDHFIIYANSHCRRAFEEVRETTRIESSVLDGGSIAFLFEDGQEMRAILDGENGLPFHGLRSLGEEIFDVSIEAISDSNGKRSGSLVTLYCVTSEQANAIKFHEAMEAERESTEALKESAVRDRQRADLDHEVATELRLKADRISEVVVAAATGDLTQRTDLRGDSPMDQIASDLDRFLDDLADRILQIREISVTLNQAGNQLDQVGRNLVEGSRRTTDEVSAVAQAWTATNDEVEGIGRSVDRLAGSFGTISDNALTALEVAGSGVLAARTARTAIEELDQSTKQIDAILTFIDQIADQSKLLSLNASIEAARAGETGRGFSVVAQEVKKLASQTEDATRQIAGTISEILERGDRSVASIHAIGAVIDEINESQSLISEIVSDQELVAKDVSRVTDETRKRAQVIAASIEQLSLVAEATQSDAAGTDREARRLLDLAQQIGDLTERFVC